MSMTKAPKMIPKEVIITALKSPPPYSIDGITKEKQVADSIIPAAKPSITSRSFCETFFVKKTGTAPKAVISPGKTRPKATIASLVKYLSIINLL